MSLDMLIRKYFKSKISCCVLIFDIVSIAVAWSFAFTVANNFVFSHDRLVQFGLITFLVALLIQLITYRVFRVYSSVWRFSSLSLLLKLIKAIVLADVVLIVVYYFQPENMRIPYAVFIVYPLVLMALWSLGRLLVRAYHERHSMKRPNKKLLIIGGGKAAELFIRDVKRNTKSDYHPAIILDDDSSLHGRDIHNVKVIGEINSLEESAKKYHIDMIVIALPSITGSKMLKIIESAKRTGLPVRMLPSLNDITSGKVAITQLRNVSLEDLLGREPIQASCEIIKQEIIEKTVMITGGGGSIGLELCRQILAFNPKKLVIIDHSEYSLYQAGQELTNCFLGKAIILCLVDITDYTALAKVLEEHRPQIIYHAAAYKHVPMLEYQIRQAIKNNFYGTKLLAELSVCYGVKKFVMISTDKAVNPTNIMGATKRASEVFCQNYNSQQETTKFVTVRFGNVLGSAGSVIPLFKQQLEQGGPLTVTHPDISRYFMTIPEACQLVTLAGAHGIGGEIFVLDMGEPVKIKYLAEELIKLSGKKPYEEIDIIYTGLRPGEKLYEELFHEKEKLEETGVDKIFKSSARGVSWGDLEKMIATLAIIFEKKTSDEDLLKLLKILVPEYKRLGHECSIVSNYFIRQCSNANINIQNNKT